MKKIFLLAAAVLILCNAMHAEESPNYVSTTFQDVLSRVEKRDETSGAILRVKAKEDSPRHRSTLQFSINQQRNADEVIISLTWNNKMHDGVYERYRLRIDSAMREELKKQKYYQ